MNKPSVTDEAIRMIKPDELKYEHPKVPFMKTSSSEVYRGRYHGFTVAIKRYIDPVSTSPRSACSTTAIPHQHHSQFKGVVQIYPSVAV